MKPEELQTAKAEQASTIEALQQQLGAGTDAVSQEQLTSLQLRLERNYTKQPESHPAQHAYDHSELEESSHT